MGKEGRTEERKAEMYSESREILRAQPLQPQLENNAWLDKGGTPGKFVIQSPSY